jgi:hypothetical protein
MDSVSAFYAKISDPIEAAKQVGIWLARSQMMGPITAEQGQIVAFDAMSRGLPIGEYPQNYNIVCGRLCMKPEAMLAGFNEIGGKHQIIQRSADACEITFNLNDTLETFSLTWEEAKKEAWPYKKDGKSIKETWAGPVGRADMLWARNVSRAVRKLAPSVTAGRYTPEEIQDLPEYADAISNGNGGHVKEAKVYDADELLAKKPASATPALPSPSPAKSPVNSPAKPAVKSAEIVDGYATSEQTDRIRELFTILAVPTEKQEQALAKRGVNALRSLTSIQAGELIANLESRLPPAPTEPEQSKQPSTVTSQQVEAPCTQSQIDGIKQMVIEIAENDGDFGKKYLARLAEFGKTKTTDLSIREADVVMRHLVGDNLEAFFTKSLLTLVEEAQIEPEGVPF